MSFPECGLCGFRHAKTAPHGNGTHPEVIHQCPPGDSGIMPCCDRTSFAIPMWNRMSVDSKLVTCRG